MPEIEYAVVGLVKVNFVVVGVLLGERLAHLHRAESNLVGELPGESPAALAYFVLQRGLARKFMT
jgi:hypothetical protein